MTPAGVEQLKQDEGCRLTAYPDPSSPFAAAKALAADKRPAGWQGLSKAPWTCGYGCTGDDIDESTAWTPAEAEQRLAQRIASTEAALRRNLPWFADLQASSPVRADVLVNIAFNIGVAGLLKWPNTLHDVQAGAYAAAADEIAGNGVWKSQVHDRCTRCADAMRTGSW